ncbi:hypothetical protein [Hoeflea sp.]|uniref:hypothetical protein n=1 Tax=Hoeflea sp. TaxID=1940281 RepID=UPI0019C4F90E|nr:hypothetical protein [Hoeflea sp.]MBC7280011.1 hypothetical protein [Hoeflea sp.]
MSAAKKFIVVVAAGLSAGAALAYFGVIDNPLEPALYAKCEDVLKRRLKSPSSYKRVKMWPSEKSLSAEQYAVEKPDMADSSYGLKKLADIESGALKPVLRQVLIEYDAQNGFGAAIRGAAKCSYVADSSNDRILGIMVRINGKTHTDWLVESIRN